METNTEAITETVSLHVGLNMYRYAVMHLMPPTVEKARTGDWGEEMHALLTSRSDVEEALARGERLTGTEQSELKRLDAILRQRAPVILAAAYEYQRERERFGYSRAHWWWYLDETLAEAVAARSHRTSRKTSKTTTKGVWTPKVGM